MKRLRTLIGLWFFVSCASSGAWNVDSQYILREDSTKGSVVVIGGGEFFRYRGEEIRGAVMAWNPESNTDVQIYRAPEALNGRNHLNNLSVSSTQLIAFTAWLRSDEGSRNALIIIDSNGTILHSVVQPDIIHALSWSPDGRAIAYVAGKGTEEHSRAYQHARTCIYWLDRGDCEQILDGGYLLQWAGFDGNIYIYDAARDPVVQRYNVEKKSMEPTEMRFVRLSPDGKHYIGVPWDERTEIYALAHNEPVSTTGPPSLRQVFDRIMLGGWYDNDWVKSGEFLVSIKSGEIRNASADVLGKYCDASAVVIASDGKLKLEALDSMQVIKPDDIPYSIIH